jgi:hypothetical protein
MFILSAKSWSSKADFPARPKKVLPQAHLTGCCCQQSQASHRIGPNCRHTPRGGGNCRRPRLRSTRFGTEEEGSRLGFAFRWTKLSGRELMPWAKPSALITGGHRARVDEITTFTDLSLGTPTAAIAPFVEEAIGGRADRGYSVLLRQVSCPRSDPQVSRLPPPCRWIGGSPGRRDPRPRGIRSISEHSVQLHGNYEGRSLGDRFDY